MKNKYGIQLMYETAGIDYYPTWDNGIARSWSPDKNKGTKVPNLDPYDKYFDLHCKYAEDDIITVATVYGNGILDFFGVTPRGYFECPSSSGWQDIEFTWYFRYLGKVRQKGGAFVINRGSGRSNHYYESVCWKCGNGYSFESKVTDKILQLKKELKHHDGGCYADNKKAKQKGILTDDWVGHKLILKNEKDSRAVNITAQRDLTFGNGGGVWKDIIKYTDTGNWKMTDKKDLKLFKKKEKKKCTQCEHPATPTEVNYDPQKWCYIRNDNTHVQYTMLHIHQI